jgi:hypothetical protein
LKVPDSRAVAGIFFEAIGQRRLREETVLELIPMVKLDDRKGIKSDSADKEAMPQWHSGHMDLPDALLEAAFKERILANVHPSQTLEFTDDGPSSVKSGIYYVPEATNHEALDSFLLLDEHLFIFQFTIGTHHGIKPGLIKFLKGRPGVPDMVKWRFVFVIPPNLIVKCPQPWLLELRQLQLYSAVVTI